MPYDHGLRKYVGSRPSSVPRHGQLRLVSRNVDNSSVSALHDLKVKFLRTRAEMLRRKREGERLARLAQDTRVFDLAQVASILGLNPETARLRMDAGEIRGAYLERGEWCIRACDLAVYVHERLASRSDLTVFDFLEEKRKEA